MALASPDIGLEALAILDAQNAGIDPTLYVNQIQQESGFNPLAYNAGAAGIAQIEPETASNPGYGLSGISDPYNPYDALAFGANYDAALLGATGSYVGMLNAYGTTAGGAAPQLASEAQALDAGRSCVPSWSNLWCLNPGQAFGYNNQPSNFPSNQFVGATGLTGSQTKSTVDTLNTIQNVITDYGSRFLFIVLGIVLLFSAFMLWRGQNPVKVVAAKVGEAVAA